jgi:hypothetical protein
MKIKLKFVNVYSEDDKSFGGDVENILLFVNGFLIEDFGDEYHEKASACSNQYLNLLQQLYPDTFEVEELSTNKYPKIKKECSMRDIIVSHFGAKLP